MTPASCNDLEAFPELSVGDARKADLQRVIEIDEAITSKAKGDYWQDLFTRYGDGRSDQGFFLVARTTDGTDAASRVVGFIIGEVRAWEFGSQPCGWVFAEGVDPEARLGGAGTVLFKAIKNRFQATGVTKLRTMIARNNHLMMAFFRSQGMMAGRYIQLEMDLDGSA